MTIRSLASRPGWVWLTLIFAALSPPLSADESTAGQLTGGVKYEIPGWFKESFLELADDVEEAAAENKHVLLYFHLDECPYCAKMLEDGFLNPEYTAHPY